MAGLKIPLPAARFHYGLALFPMFVYNAPTKEIASPNF